jgi:very-short-patch-repair endonuclease
MTTPERVLWSRLRGSRLDGLKFRRQHPVGPYVADFYCHEAALVVETDSMWHYNVAGEARDEERDRWFAERGILTLRVSASWLARDEHAVLAKIVEVARERIAELDGRQSSTRRRSRPPHDPPPVSQSLDHLPRLSGGGGEPSQ